MFFHWLVPRLSDHNSAPHPMPMTVRIVQEIYTQTKIGIAVLMNRIKQTLK